MAINWSTFLQAGLDLPETLDEAVKHLLTLLSGEYKVVLATMQEDELIDLRFSLGIGIQNAFVLGETGSKLLASCGAVNPDDASGLIISELWRSVQS
ncbi:MAG: hypothetical protein PHO08_20235 [Methylococcales bacterium]|nr:hypothetical protein [Methylococcales bacterium]MDD5633261.1 hypothetical protein [Methylococcales bacterium]